ncbi:MerR family transcriptional regulator [Bombiscardovia apis]|uniref:MerR family transcriptional regulator n=2 Tax=Bombiscardovia apis TaxID=2932182 RepID=A0ABN6SJ32_9BIFI|nr:MerR family transcriptional regulator [Bombiscardovia apis]
MQNAESETVLTIGKVSQLLGVSERMLRHWEEAGLVSPPRSWSDYREYGPDDIARLKRVVLYRELGLNARQIREVLASPGSLAVSELNHHRAHLVDKIKYLTAALGTLDSLIATAEGKATQGDNMTDTNTTATSAVRDMQAEQEEAHERWGQSQQWMEYAERMASRSKAQKKEDLNLLQAIETQLGQAKREGMDPTCPEALDLIEQHRHSLSWFQVSPSMHVMLGRMYACDPRFKSHYEAIEPGLAEWMQAAIEANAQTHGIDPATAKWE